MVFVSDDELLGDVVLEIRVVYYFRPSQAAQSGSPTHPSDHSLTDWNDSEAKKDVDL